MYAVATIVASPAGSCGSLSSRRPGPPRQVLRIMVNHTSDETPREVAPGAAPAAPPGTAAGCKVVINANHCCSDRTCTQDYQSARRRDSKGAHLTPRVDITGRERRLLGLHDPRCG